MYVYAGNSTSRHAANQISTFRILSTLIPNADSTINARVQTLNDLFRNLVQDFQNQGHHILLAEMNNGFITASDLGSDGIHPSNGGYPKLSAVWTVAINKAYSNGWISSPVESSFPLRNGLRGPIQTQRGSGQDDGTYTHLSQDMGVQYHYDAGVFMDHAKSFHFAQLVLKGADPPGQADDMIRVLDPDQRKTSNADLPAVSFRENVGGGSFADAFTPIDVGTECSSIGARWGDINGNGLDDFICIDAVSLQSSKIG
jgi:hypothetical protein